MPLTYFSVGSKSKNKNKKLKNIFRSVLRNHIPMCLDKVFETVACDFFELRGPIPHVVGEGPGAELLK